jgi:hypothetical protein
MAPSLTTQIIRDSVLEAALNLSNDPIPNIRFNVAKCLETLATQLIQSSEGGDVIERQILPALRKLQDDNDADVRYAFRVLTDSRYFATKAQEHTSSLLSGNEPMSALHSASSSPSSPSPRRSLSVSRTVSGQMPLSHAHLHSKLSPVLPTTILVPCSSDPPIQEDVEMTDVAAVDGNLSALGLFSSSESEIPARPRSRHDKPLRGHVA